MSQFLISSQEDEQARTDLALGQRREPPTPWFDLMDLPGSAARGVQRGFGQMMDMGLRMNEADDRSRVEDQLRRMARGESPDPWWRSDVNIDPIRGFAGGRRYDWATNEFSERLPFGGWQSQSQRRTALNRLQPQPGAAYSSQILSNVANIFTLAAAGGEAAPLQAAMIGGISFDDARQRLIEQGVDPGNANIGGAIEGGFMAAGAFVPASLGFRSMLMRAAAGAAINTTFGGVMRGGMSAFLTNAGYPRLAEQYKWLDPQAMVIDAIIGAGFGAMHRPAKRNGRDGGGDGEQRRPAGEPNPRAPQATGEEWLAAAHALEGQGRLEDAYAHAEIARARGAKGAEDLIADLEQRGGEQVREQGRALAGELERGIYRPSPTLTAAALAQLNALHRNILSAPGFPATPHAQRVHNTLAREAERQADHDEAIGVQALFEQAIALRRPEREPETLTRFLIGKGGLKDERGEISHAMGGRTGRETRLVGLINGRGQQLDDAALAAWEAGFFPEFADRPPIDALIAALREEAAGNPRYSIEDDAAARDSEDRAAFEREFAERNIDPFAPDDVLREQIREAYAPGRFIPWPDVTAEAEQALRDAAKEAGGEEAMAAWDEALERAREARTPIDEADTMFARGDDAPGPHEGVASYGTPEQWADLLDMIDRGATGEEILASPIARAFNAQTNKTQTLSSTLLNDPMAMRDRAFVIDGKPATYAEAIEHGIRRAASYVGGLAHVRRERRATIVVGNFAAGKSTFIEAVARHEGAAVGDADFTKTMLPEFENGKNSVITGNASSVMRWRIFDRFLERGDNVVIENVGNSARIMLERKAWLESLGYTVRHVHINVEANEAVRRQYRRAYATGRFIEPRSTRKIVLGGQVEKAFNEAVATDGFGDYIEVNGTPPPHQAQVIRQSGAEDLADAFVRSGLTDDGRGSDAVAGVAAGQHADGRQGDQSLAEAPEGWDRVGGELNGQRPRQAAFTTPGGAREYHTVESALAEARAVFGDKLEALMEAGRLKFVASHRETPISGFLDMRPGVKAFYSKSADHTFLIAGNILPGQVKGLILHEIGVHAGMARMLGERRFEALLRSVDRLVAAKNEDAVAARAHAEKHSARAESVREETLAWLVTWHADAPVVVSLLAKVRRWLFETFGTTFGTKLTIDDLRELAVASLRREGERARRDMAPGGWLAIERAKPADRLNPLQWAKDETPPDAGQFEDHASVTSESGKGRVLQYADGAGRIWYEPRGDGWVIDQSGMDKGQRGQGRGVALYEELIRRAREAGASKVRSGNSVSHDAQNVYAALERRGYRVTRTDRGGGAIFSVDTASPARPESGAEARAAETLSDAEAALRDDPEMMVPDANGIERPAAELMAKARDDIAFAKDEGPGMEAAARCGGRHEGASPSPRDYRLGVRGGGRARMNAMVAGNLLGFTMGSMGAAYTVAADHIERNRAARRAEAERLAFDNMVSEQRQAEQETRRQRYQQTQRAIDEGDPMLAPDPAMGEPTRDRYGLEERIVPEEERGPLLNLATEITGADRDYVSRVIDHEARWDASNTPWDPSKGRNLSTARGLGQFTDDTWRDMRRFFPNARGLSDDEWMAKRDDPRMAATAAGYFAVDNARILRQRTGRTPTQAEVYLAHFLGADGAVRLLHLRDIGANNAAAAMPEAAASNESVFYNPDGSPRSAAQVVAVQAGDFIGANGRSPAFRISENAPLERGNINLHNRPVHQNEDGSISTVRSITIEADGRFVVLPTIADDGRLMSDEEAIGQYRDTGRHLGIFASEDAADRYAQRLHERQAAEYLAH